jgi:cardiolipin synthase
VRWCSGNDFDLLENGEEYFPRLIDAIDAAAQEILLETYIFRDDDVGKPLVAALVRAAGRGVRATLTVDGYGTPAFPQRALGILVAAGVSVRSFDPQSAWFVRTNLFCRLHRKIVVIDRRLAFIGGINIWADHLRAAGPDSMQDFAVRVRGPVVEDIVRQVRPDRPSPPSSRRRRWRRRFRGMPRSSERPAGGGQAAFVVRDNEGHRTDIEHMYRAGIRSARRQIVIANAYFFPGYRLLRDLVRAARRGVDVTLILQGRPDVILSAMAASILYDYLMSAGVRIFHYCERPMHAKVAVIDERWATVGSSNLDPISLSLNLEANLFVLDDELAASLRSRLAQLIAMECKEMVVQAPRRSFLRRYLLPIVYHVARPIPRWRQRLLGRPRIANVPPVRESIPGFGMKFED